jgi:integrase
MSVTVRPHVTGGWEVDIRVELPDGTMIRERKRAPSTSKSAAQRWAEARERVLLVHGKPKPAKKEEVEQRKPTLQEFAPRFVDGYAKANRLKPSGVASKKTILNVHLIPVLGNKQLDQITTEDVQGLKSALAHRSPKTVNNVLAVLSVLVTDGSRVGSYPTRHVRHQAAAHVEDHGELYDFGEYARLLDVARSDPHAYLIAVLGGEAGLRCGEMMALEWTDVDMNTRQLCVARSEWKGHVTVPKGGRLRYVPLTRRLTEALRQARHLRGVRVLCDKRGQPFTQKVIQVTMRRVARRANVKSGIHILRHTFCSHLAMRGAPARAIQELAGHQDLETTQRYMHLSPAALDAAIRLLDEPLDLPAEAGSHDHSRGEIVEAAGNRP